MGIGGVLKRLKPYLAMVFLQFGFAGMYIVSLMSLKRGMSHYVLVVYRNAAATVVLAPFALWFERKGRPKMTIRCFLKIMALALLEPVLDQNLYYVGAMYTSASFAAALINILPAVTFVIAVVLRMEKLNVRSLHSQAKIVGTAITVVGAILMVLYKGPVVELFWSKWRSHPTGTTSGQDHSHWLVGTIMVLVSCVCWSGFFILQSHTIKSYPAELSLATLICFMGVVESSIVAVTMERGSKPWSIGWDARLFTAVYSGVMCSGVAYYVQGIVMKERGPVFVTAFNPLCMIITALLGSIILAEQITLGRVIGAIIIVMGLYSLIWGKSKDFEEEKQDAMKLPVSSSTQAHHVVEFIQLPPSIQKP